MKSDTKIFILDTSVLLHRPESLFSFGKHDVVIPVVVLNEIDGFKKGSQEINRNARHAISTLDKLRGMGKISEGIPLDERGASGTLKVEVALSEGATTHLPDGFGGSNDNIILGTAVQIAEANPDRVVVLVSKDINMRVKAEALNLSAEDYRADQIVEISELYRGYREITVDPATFQEIYQSKYLDAHRLPEQKEPLASNEFVMLINEASPSSTALTRYDCGQHELNLLTDQGLDVWGIRPLNREQRFALEILLDDNIPLVTISGKAGTGKTILAIATGLHKVMNEKKYRRLAIYRPVIPMGRDIGFLPGTEQEKLLPWMQPVFDNLEFLLEEDSSQNNGNKKGNRIDYLIDSNILDIRALTYIRGRSLPQQFIVVDESQNLTPHEVKTIITRVGHGTKLIFTGDPYQIDSPYLDATSNGLTHTVEKFRGQKLAGHITLRKGERSPLAELASTIMEQ